MIPTADLKVNRWIQGLAWLSLLPLASADVLDDASVSVDELFRFPRSAMGQHGADTGLFMQDIPLSADHEAEIRGGMPLLPSYVRLLTLPRLHEARGDYDRALAAMQASEDRPFDRIRLLMRLGRDAEARAVLTDELVVSLESTSGYQAFWQLTEGCRPLENGEHWEVLNAYLGILKQRLVSPAWQTAFCQEEVDIAWNRDKVEELLASAAGDKARLCIYHERLGNRAESERLSGEIIAGLEPAQLVEAFSFIPQGAVMKKAATELWKRADLPAEVRGKLWLQLDALPSSADFGREFLAWLNEGGDPAPFADLIWQRRLQSSVSSDIRLKELEKLHELLPGDTRFEYLLARHILSSDGPRALDLFTSVAGSPLRSGGEASPDRAYFDEIRSGGTAGATDPALLGLTALGLLNRQDKVKEALDSHASWRDLPAMDQARYLAAGRMDRDLVDLVLNADLLAPESVALPSWLAAVIKKRGAERAIPTDVFARIAEKLPDLVLGVPGKTELQITHDAGALIEVLGESPLDPATLTVSINRSLDAAAALSRESAESLRRTVISTGARFPLLKIAFPNEGKNAGAKTAYRSVAAKNLEDAIILLSPPLIERLGPVREDFYPPSGLAYGRNPRYAPLKTMVRWLDGVPRNGLPAEWKNDAILTLMRGFPAGHPRRILADILVATGTAACPDEALKAESLAAVEAVVAGESKLRGLELFRYFSLVARGEKEEVLIKVLQDIKKLPPPVVRQFLDYLRQDYSAQASDLATRILENPGPVATRTPSKPDGDLETLKKFLSQNRGGSPEAIRLAHFFLDKALKEEAEADDLPGSPRDWSGREPAMQVLALTDGVSGWREASFAKLREEGMPELKILQLLRSIERSYRLDNEAAHFYARKIFEIDPGDVDAAVILIGDAVAANDKEMVVACLKVTGLSGLLDLPSKTLAALLSSFRRGDEAKLLQGIESLPGFANRSETGCIAKLHGFFLSADPALAGRFRQWIQKQAVFPVFRETLAEQLMVIGDRTSVTDLYVMPPVGNGEFTGAPWAFLPKPGGKWTDSSRITTEEFRPQLDFLTKHHLLPEVWARISTLGGPVDLKIETLRLASSPDPVATLEGQVLPALAAWEDMKLKLAILDWIELFGKYPQYSSLSVKLIEEGLSDQYPRPFELSSAIKSVSKFDGGAPLIARLWAALAKGLQADDRGFREAIETSAIQIFPMMLRAADDATWSDYWRWRKDLQQPLGNLFESASREGADPFIRTERLREVLPRALGEPKVLQNNETLPGWVGYVLQTGDTELIKRMKAMLPEGGTLYRDLCDLALGDAGGIKPVFGASTEKNGDIALWWNLVSVPSRYGDSKVRDIPAVSFPLLDGKLDITIAGGAEPGRLATLETIHAANAAGQIHFKAEQEVSHIALLITGKGEGGIQWTPTVSLSDSAVTALDFSAGVLQARGLRKVDLPGPGGLPAYQCWTAGKDRVELAEMPWTGSGGFSCGAWVLGSEGLYLFCYDSAGRQTDEIRLPNAVTTMPVWQYQKLQLPEEKTLPPSTVRLVLAARFSKSNDSRCLLISGLHASPAGEIPLPEGFQKLGRVSGKPGDLALSPDSGKVAVGLQGGKVEILDLSGGSPEEVLLGGWNYGEDKAAPLEVKRLEWVGKWLFALDSDQILNRINTTDMKTTDTPIGSGNDNSIPELSFSVTRDGKWLAWMENRKLLVLEDVENGARREIPLEVDSSIQTSDEGIRISANDGTRLLLRNEDLAAGFPMGLDPSTPLWSERFSAIRTHPRWEGRIDTNSLHTGRNKQGGRDFVSIPAGRCYDFAPDGTIYYVDSSGVVMRVTP